MVSLIQKRPKLWSSNFTVIVVFKILNIKEPPRFKVFSISLKFKWYIAYSPKSSLFRQSLPYPVPPGNRVSNSVSTLVSWSVFSCIWLNTEIYGINPRIQSEYRKIRTRKSSIFGHFSSSVTIFQMTHFRKKRKV